VLCRIYLHNCEETCRCRLV